jgi:hypothetical protein
MKTAEETFTSQQVGAKMEVSLIFPHPFLTSVIVQPVSLDTTNQVHFVTKTVPISVWKIVE